MASQYTYQKVNDAESDGEFQDLDAAPKSSTKNGEFSLGQSTRLGWFKRPSVSYDPAIIGNELDALTFARCSGFCPCSCSST